MSNLDESKIKKAKDIAKSHYKDRYRISGESYFNHVENIVDELRSLRTDSTNLIILGYVHHLIEFDSKAKDIIKKEFGKEVCDLAQSYYHISSKYLPKVEKGHLNESVIVQAFLNLIDDPIILLLRIVDKAESIKTAHFLDHTKAEMVANKALYLYAPIARLMGLYKYVRILEDNAFKLINPRDYYIISEFLRLKRPAFLRSLDETKKIILELLGEQNINCEISHRVKHIYSIYIKAVTKKIDITLQDLENVKDIAAMRILVDTVEQCYTTEDMLNNLFDYYEELRDDYIQKPKPNGYQSLQNIFKLNDKVDCEIQIRTFEMHQTSEFGGSSHVLYKLSSKIKSRLTDKSDFLKDFSIHVGETVKFDHFKNLIYIFTPKGDIIELPKGSNLIDFAYYIHADLGNSCVGGLVNNEFQKVTYELKTGDRVEIKTSGSKRKPSSDWYDLVKTSKAKFAIKRALKDISQK